jgi:glycosyltransferase involved in cell wall biosynthesis
MKVLFSQTYYLPYTSGLTYYSARQAENLARRGHDVTALAIKHRVDLAASEILNGIKVIRARQNARVNKSLFSWEWFVKALHEAKENEVLIINLPQVESVWLAICGKVFNKRIISIYHCDVSLGNGIINKIIEVITNFSSRVVCTLSDRILASTHDYAINSPVLKYLLQKITYIYPPVKISHCDKKGNQRINSQLKGGGKYLIGAVGRWSREKGYEYLIKSIPFLDNCLGPNNYKIVFAGTNIASGEEKYYQYLKRLIESCGKKVVYLGQLSNIELACFYKTMDVIVIPSINSLESFSLVQAEAMLAGIPVVVTDLPGLRIPVNKTGMGRVVKKQDPRDLAEGICDVLKNSLMLRKNLNVAKKEFSEQKILTDFEKAISKR